MDFDLRKVAAHIRTATTEELLDRVTIYRDDTEPAAVDLIEHELARRGVTRDQISGHERERRATALVETDGFVTRCAFCDRPAIVRAWTWHRPHRRIRLFPQRLSFCELHAVEYEIAAR